MTTEDQIQGYIAEQPQGRRSEMLDLHRSIVGISPESELWFLDGKNAAGKTVSNPNIGYGRRTIEYAGGKKKDFYRVGLSANTTGLSVYIMGIPDKEYLNKTFSGRIGKASVSGYCIKFRTLSDIDRDVLEEAIRLGLSPLELKGSPRKISRP